MLNFPSTYQNLLQAGIQRDFSMGYTNLDGFRASYCYPFKWYNLSNEMLTPLTINPFCIAENTLKYFAQKENKLHTHGRLIFICSRLLRAGLRL